LNPTHSCREKRERAHSFIAGWTRRRAWSSSGKKIKAKEENEEEKKKKKKTDSIVAT